MGLFLALLSGSFEQLAQLQHPVYLLISSLTLAVTWVLYYLGLADGPVGGVLALQNLAIIFTMVLESLVLGMEIRSTMLFGVGLIAVASVLMIEPPRERYPSGQSRRWVLYEILSAMFMSVSFIFTKMDTSPVDSNLSSGIRYSVVAITAFILMFLTGSHRTGGSRSARRISRAAWRSVVLGGIFLGIGYIALYRAMSLNTATLVTTIFRFNIVFAAVLSAVFLKEKQSSRSVLGLCAMTGGIVLFAV
ncbi:EamA family transporter [Ihubacter sp. rT4E-8]|uniref:DMT family transporter n=1 Tax=Ihubacter sp. rT4E-8 TaxID=3242369 RepID=UPI003CF70113